MHLIQLTEDLQKELKEHFKHNKFQQRDHLANPDIKTGWYTSKRRDEDLPYILISPVTDTSNDDEDVIRIFFVCAVYNETEEGWKDASLLAEHIKLYLRTNWKVGDVFSIDKFNKPIVISYPDVQPEPQWLCTVEAYFNVVNIQDSSAYNEAFGLDYTGREHGN